MTIAAGLSTSGAFGTRAALVDPGVVARWNRRGTPMPAALRRRMERKLGIDLRAVRIHVGDEPASLESAAFCHGDHIYFSPGLYPPQTALQRRVLEHELTHVMQQRAGWVVNPFGGGTALVVDDALEEAADHCVPSPGLTRARAREDAFTAQGAGRDRGSVVQCINYLHITEMGANYKPDPTTGRPGEEGTSGHRHAGSPAITSHENALMAAIIKRDDLHRRANPVVRPGGRPMPVPAAVPGLLAEAEAKVLKYRTWLEREDFVLNADGSINWAASHKTVVYDHDLAAQNLTRIFGQGGILYTNQACTVPLDTSGMVTHFSGPGFAIYVMSNTGNIHVSTHKLGHRHHSSLLKGGDVAGAGELRTNAAGKLLWLSNKSGHYAPSPIHLNQVIHQLDKFNVARDYAIKEFSGPGGGVKKDYPTVTDYLNDIVNTPNSPHYELQKLLAYRPMLTDAILGPNGWEFKDGSSGWGVYRLGTNDMVPHKQARSWLKIHVHRANPVASSGVGR